MTLLLQPTLPPSCPFITLVRFVWKISGFRYFPIHCHWYDRDKFGFYLWQFLLHDVLRWLVRSHCLCINISGIFQWLVRYYFLVWIYHSGSWNKHIFHILQDDTDTFIESLKTRFMVLNMRYQNYFFLPTAKVIFSKW